MKKLILFALLLLIIPIAAALPTIHQPYSSEVYHSGIVDFNVTWDTSPTSCWYNINTNVENHTIPGCDTEFIIDVFLEDNNTINLYNTNATGTYNQSVVFEIDRNFYESDGFLIGLLGLIPLIIAFAFFFVASYLSAETNTPLKLFLTLGGFVFLMIQMNVAVLLIREYLYIPKVIDAMLIYGIQYWIFYIIFAYFLIQFIWHLFLKLHVMNQKRKMSKFEELM